MPNDHKHRLVVIGDSLSQGFKSGAIFEPNLSYPAIIAWEMGLNASEFRFAPFSGKGGLPINIEYLLRRMDRRFGENVDWWEIPLSAMYLREWMDDIEDYWERGPGAAKINISGPIHNLAVWGFEVQDAYQLTAGYCQSKVGKAGDNWVNQVPEDAMLRTALRVLNPGQLSGKSHQEATQITRAGELARDGGIENLIVFLGANNILGTVTSLDIKPSRASHLSEKDVKKRHAAVNFYEPEHFEKALTKLMTTVEGLNEDNGKVERVFWGTIPSVTIPPVTNGVGGRLSSAIGLGDSPYGKDDDPDWYRRYFRYYTRPWVPADKFRPEEDAYLPGEEVVKIDRAIAQYNQFIKTKIAEHNQKAGKNEWIEVDLHWTLERLAFRRYQEDPSVPAPPNWAPYEMPESLESLNLNTRFLKASQGKRIDGGIFSLDGIHPTTTAYGIVAQEFIDKMQDAGVVFKWGNRGHERNNRTIERQGRVRVDFQRLIRLDSLINRLPYTLDDLWKKVVDGDQLLDLFSRAIRWIKP